MITKYKAKLTTEERREIARIYYEDPTIRMKDLAEQNNLSIMSVCRYIQKYKDEFVILEKNSKTNKDKVN